MGPLARRLVRPPGWWTAGVVALPGLPLLWWGIWPEFYYMTHIAMLFLLWIATLVLVLLRSAVSGTVAKLKGYRQDSVWSEVLGIGRALAPAVLVTLLLLTNMPLRLAFLTAKPELDRIIDATPKGTPLRVADGEEVGWFGLWRIDTARSERRGRWQDVPCHVVYLDCGGGFVHFTGDIVDFQYNDGSHGWLIGDWYWFKED